VKQEDPGDSFYIIRSGKVRAYRRDDAGLELVLSVLGPGESFGEMALLTGQERSANVEALEETHLMVLSKEQFERILRDFPHISRAFLKQMSERILRDEKIIEKEIRRQYLAPRVSWFDFVLVIGVSLVLALLFNRSNPNGISLFPNLPDKNAVSSISAASAMEQIKKGDTVIVDAGPEGFYQRKHIQGAISVPLSLSDVLYDVTFREEHKGKKVIVYGGTFSRLYDRELAGQLYRRGHKDVKVLDGGSAAWEKAGYPVEKWEEKK
jgi:CRP-like cAMP-binding protein